MRNLDTLTTILVLGILSSTIAQEQITSGSETTTEETPRLDIGITGGSAVFGIPIRFENDALIKDCEKNGGPTAYTTLEAGVLNLSNCTQLLLNSTEIEVDKTDAFVHGKWDTVIAKYCGRLPAFVQCSNPLLGSLEACLTPADREILRSNNNISKALMEFLCQNDGNRTATFFTNGGLECMESKGSTLQQKCPLEPPGGNTQLANSRAWLQGILTNCSFIESFETCTVQVMRTCENPTPADVVEATFDFMKRRQSCPSIPVAQTT